MKHTKLLLVIFASCLLTASSERRRMRKKVSWPYQGRPRVEEVEDKPATRVRKIERETGASSYRFLNPFSLFR